MNKSIPSLLACLALMASGCTTIEDYTLNSLTFVGIETSDVHNDTDGERTEVRMLKYADGANSLRFNINPKETINLQLPDSGAAAEVFDFGMAEASALASTLLKFGLDQAQRAIEKAADAHERSFTGLAYDTDFWDVYPTQPRYAGFEIKRFTERMGDVPAFHLVCAFEYGKGDGSTFLVKPVYFVTRTAKACVSRTSGKRRLDSKIDLKLTGAYVDAQGILQTPELATVSGTFENYVLNPDREYGNEFICQGEGSGWVPVKRRSSGADSGALVKIDADDLQLWHAAFAERYIGFFSAPPVSVVKDNNGDAYPSQQGGTFKLTVVVTETDRSEVPDQLVKLSNAIGENEDDIQSAVLGALGLEQTSDDD
ncbi:MAG: hypothetical protein AAFR96_04005 [Planctomycetota bacterium]